MLHNIMTELIVNAGILLTALVGLILASGYVIGSLSAVSRYLGVSEFLISFILLALATSLSELTVGINAAISSVPELSLGDVFGTNIVNLTLILGVVAVAGKGIRLKDYEHFKQTRLTTFLLVLTPFALLLDGSLSRLDGVLLVSLFVVHIYLLTRKNPGNVPSTYRHSMPAYTQHTAEGKKAFIHNLAIFGFSASVLVISAYGVVFAVSAIAETVGVSEFILGIFLVAIGTSLPELSVGLRAARSGKESISVGNLFGAISVNTTLVLGIVSLIRPIRVSVTDTQHYLTTAGFTLVIMLLVYYLLRRDHIMHKLGGISLFVIYGLFLVIQGASL